MLSHNKLLTRERGSHWWGGLETCHSCPLSVESSLHALRDCPNVKFIWRKLVKPEHMREFFNIGFEDWIKRNLTKNFSDLHNGTRVSIWAIAVWMLWRWRCAAIHDANFTRPHDPVILILKFYDNYVKSGMVLGVNTGFMQNHGIIVRWAKPADGWTKLNYDGEKRTNLSACGGLVRNADGKWMGGFCRFVGSSSVLRAKAWGLLEGVRLALNLALDSVEIECDSRVLVDSVSDRCVICPDIRSIVVAIRQCLLNFRRWKLSHVWREVNRVADFLASFGLQRNQGDVQVFVEPPPGLVRVLREDELGLGMNRLVRD